MFCYFSIECCFHPTLGCDIQGFGPWDSVSNTDHGGSRIFQPSDWLSQVAVPLGIMVPI